MGGSPVAVAQTPFSFPHFNPLRKVLLTTHEPCRPSRGHGVSTTKTLRVTALATGARKWGTPLSLSPLPVSSPPLLKGEWLEVTVQALLGVVALDVACVVDEELDVVGSLQEPEDLLPALPQRWQLGGGLRVRATEGRPTVSKNLNLTMDLPMNLR